MNSKFPLFLFEVPITITVHFLFSQYAAKDAHSTSFLTVRINELLFVTGSCLPNDLKWNENTSNYLTPIKESNCKYYLVKASAIETTSIRNTLLKYILGWTYPQFPAQKFIFNFLRLHRKKNNTSFASIKYSYIRIGLERRLVSSYLNLSTRVLLYGNILIPWRTYQ